MTPATMPEHDVVSEASYRGLAFTDTDLGGRHAELLDLAQSFLWRLTGAGLSGVRFISCDLTQAQFSDATR